MIRNSDMIPSHLPKRLTITFPIWGLYDTGNGVYHDVDKMMREHKERGFNCIRLDDGAGLMHDRSGKPRGPIRWGHAFGPYDIKMRQFGACGEEGECDLLERLIDLFTAARKHNVFIILSSWYYLHTYWFLKNPEINDELYAIPPHERFQAFAEFLHYILLELESRGLDSQIAFAEIFNEADGLYFIDGYDHKNGLGDEELAAFRTDHETAIEWLKERHPQILFAYDAYGYQPDLRQVPGNLQVYNFHNYFLWGAYGVAEGDSYFTHPATPTHEETARALAQKYGITPDWIERARFYGNLDPQKLPRLHAKMTAHLTENKAQYLADFDRKLTVIQKLLNEDLPQVPVICGEGVSYCGGYDLVWEERSDTYWEIIAYMMEAYRKAGLWGTVVRTCCGPEDPVWNLCPDKLLEMNRIFLKP